MKKRTIVFICLFCILLYVAIIWFFTRSPKSKIANYVIQNQTSLEDYVIIITENDEIDAISTYNGWKASCHKDKDMVQFIVRSWGLIPSSKYEGFYYSGNDKPLGFFGSDVVEYFAVDKGWKWEEKDGDNWQYTERITDKWYWFEASF